MRRVILLLTCLAVTLLAGAGTASAAPLRQAPQPATLRARTVAPAGTPGALVPIEGTLLDAQRRPLTGAPVVVTVAGSPDSDELRSLTGSGGTFEFYVPLPEQVPATGVVDLQVSFGGTDQAAASSVTLPVRVQSDVAPAEAELSRPGAPAPAVTAPADHTGAATLPTSGSAFIDQLIVVASGLLGVMILLFGVGAVLRRRRS